MRFRQVCSKHGLTHFYVNRNHDAFCKKCMWEQLAEYAKKISHVTSPVVCSISASMGCLNGDRNDR